MVEKAEALFYFSSLRVLYGEMVYVPRRDGQRNRGEVEHVAPGMVTQNRLQPILVELAPRN